MLVLAIDTATTDLVVGIVDTAQGTTLAEVAVATRAHNEALVPETTRLLDEAGVAFSDLGAVVVGCGPGPFTGLRVGMSTASAFAQALGIPVHGVCTHDAVAARLDGSALVVTDARRREVYWARYENGVRTAGPDVCKPADLASEPVDVLSVPPQLAEQLSVEANEVTYMAPSPAGLVAAADLSSEPEPLVPLYLRRPDAVEPKPVDVSPAVR
ncbi:tRNA (adenosine(37)-N6)-threonylcarbamoyltransferase complex dimerization subunit type 1 TsaB [Corynebacterium sp. Marseille-P4321]|uniref:tRNA (adenosine(37)-N6)-threonylcarbamoyltransferase complex dimerization subunit type 1 TsaB n=1 Tax=Corynebacterium sp. Marseille-P4321 TaxID=2736603 RepID=UPI00158BF4AB|nr:tRNA (adenosine(37)-N6)-threonylcarbamoyltransferase complex dimerization subunit type 1 TsaB [Corynebacterium sp. Marseille-P4321]